MNKAKRLEPNEWGNYPCPHCTHILTPIVREWMNPPEVNYICHRCKILFVMKIKGDLEKWL